MPLSRSDQQDEPLDWSAFVPADLPPTVGYCSQCGEARSTFYTCRDGGETVDTSLMDVDLGDDQ